MSRRREAKRNEAKQVAEQRGNARAEEIRVRANEALATGTKRASLMAKLSPIIKKRVKGKSYVELCKEFLPKAQLSEPVDSDTLRRTLRRAMARYHPDVHSNSTNLEEAVESELIFAHLKDAYEEVQQYCKQR